MKFLLAGPGLIGRRHAQLLMSHPDCSLTAIVGPKQSDNESFALECGAKFFTRFDEALNSENFDAAIISSPNAFHFDQAVACLRKGVPVLIEKPVTDSIQDALRLVEVADSLQVPVLVGHHRTYSPLLEYVAQFLNSPKFGRPVALQGSALFYKPTQYFEDGPWRTKTGGGPILINLIHEIGLMRFFYGEIKSVFAMTGKHIRNSEVEDTAAITLNFENGALGTFILSDTSASSKSWEMTSGENAAYPHFPNDNCYHFAGTNGSLDFPSMRACYYADPSQASWWHPFTVEQASTIRRDPLKLQLQHFVDIVKGRVKPRVSARDGYLNLLVVQAIQKSAALEQTVKIDNSLGGTPAEWKVS